MIGTLVQPERLTGPDPDATRKMCQDQIYSWLPNKVSGQRHWCYPEGLGLVKHVYGHLRVVFNTFVQTHVRDGQTTSVFRGALNQDLAKECIMVGDEPLQTTY